MSNMLSIAQREMRAYFNGPAAYVLIALYLLLTTMFFSNQFVPGLVPEMRATLNMMVIPLIFLVPLLTMRLVSEELSRGTIESLMTAPVTDTQVILGKFAGAMGFMLLLLLTTLIYPAVLRIFGEPDFGPIISGYLGLVLLSGLFVSIGLLASTITRSQIIAGMSAVTVLAVMTLLTNYLAFNLEGWMRRVVRYVGFYARYENFTMGMISLGDVLFFLSITAFALFVSVKALESRKWRG